MSKYFTLLFFFLFLSACSSLPEKDRYFWPPLPGTPRIEYISSYQTRADFPKVSEWEAFLDKMLGEEDQSRIFVKPWGIASNGKGKVYITDAPQRAIIIFDLIARKVNIVEEVEDPYGIAIDKEGFLYVSSRKYHAVMVFDEEGKALRSFGEKKLVGPAGIGINKELGILYCVDTMEHNIKVFTLDGQFLYTIGERGSKEGAFNFPTDVDVDSRGNIVVADSLNARIQIFDTDGRFKRSFGERGIGLGGFQMIKGVAVDSEDHIYVIDTLPSHFKVFSSEGDLLLVVGGAGSASVPGGFNLPMDIDIDDNDRIYIIDQLNISFQIYQYLNKDYLKANPVGEN